MLAKASPKAAKVAAKASKAASRPTKPTAGRKRKATPKKGQRAAAKPKARKGEAAKAAVAGGPAPCTLTEGPVEPWLEAIDTCMTEEWALSLGRVLTCGPRWLDSSFAADAVGCSCGAVGSRETWTPIHDPAEVTVCKAISAALVDTMKDVFVDFSESSRHWFPLIAPRSPGQPWNTMDVKTLQQACGGALCPVLEFMVKPLAEFIQSYDGDEECGAALAKLAETFQGFGCAQPTSFFPVYIYGNETVPSGIPVYPHFVAALTPGGSVVGLVGLVTMT
eukprot:EG_transcript_23082